MVLTQTPDDGRLYYNEEQIAAAKLRVLLDEKQGKKSPWFLIQIAEKGYIDSSEH